MKILTKRKQEKILDETIKITEAIVSYGNSIEILKCMEQIANIQYEVGGIKALKDQKDKLERL